MQTKFTPQRLLSREMWAECVCDKCCHEEEKQKEFTVSEFHGSSKNVLTSVLFSSFLMLKRASSFFLRNNLGEMNAFNLLLSFSSPGSTEQRDHPAATQESLFDVKTTWLNL